MCPTGSREHQSQLETLADTSRGIESTRSEGVFCCPECGTRLQLVGRSAVSRADPLVWPREASSANSAFDTLPAGPIGGGAPSVKAAQTPVAEGGGELPRSEEHSGFFGVLSNLMVDWGDAEGDAPSRVRCAREPIAALPESANAANCDPMDIDWLLESTMRLASQSPRETPEADVETSDSNGQADAGSRAQDIAVLEPTAADRNVYGIDLAELDTSVIPITVVDEPSTEEAMLTVSSNHHTDAEMTDGAAEASQRAAVTDAPHGDRIESSSRFDPTVKTVGLGLGVTAMVGLVVLSLYYLRPPVAERLTSPAAAPTIAPWVLVTRSFRASAIAAAEPSAPDPTVDELTLEVEPASTNAKPVIKSTEVVANTEDAQAEGAQLESQPPAAPELTTDSEPGTTIASFDAEAAARELDQVADRASSCRQTGDPSGMAVVSITLASSGRVTTANISAPPFKGTATGSCVASLMRTARVPAFAGSFATVTKIVTIR